MLQLKKKKAMLKSSNSFSGVRTLSMIAEEGSTDGYSFVANKSVSQCNKSHIKIGDSARGNTFDPFAPDIAHKINEFYVWDCISSDTGKEELMRTLILEVGNKDQLFTILSTEVDMDRLVEIFPDTFTHEISSSIKSSDLRLAKHEQLLNGSLDYRLYPTLQSFICYINSNHNQNLRPIVQDVVSEGTFTEDDIVIIPHFEGEEKGHTISVSDEQILTDKTHINDVVLDTRGRVNPFLKPTVTIGNLSIIDDESIIFVDEESITDPSLSAGINVLESTINDESSDKDSKSSHVVLATDLDIKESQVKETAACNDTVDQKIQASVIELCGSKENVVSSFVTKSSVLKEDVIRRVNHGKTSGKAESRPNNILFADVNTLMIHSTIDKSTTGDDDLKSSKEFTSKVTSEDSIAYDSYHVPSSDMESVNTGTSITCSFYSTSFKDG